MLFKRLAIILVFLLIFGFSAFGIAEEKIKETNDEVIIEFVYYEGTENQKIVFGSKEEVLELINKKQLRKKASCLGKFKGEISKAISIKNPYGILIVYGKAIKKKSEKNEKDYVTFEGKLEFISKDKNYEWEASPVLKLLKGEKTIVGRFTKSTEEAAITGIIIATWCLKKKSK